MEREQLKNEEKVVVKKGIEHVRHFGRMLWINTKIRIAGGPR